MANYIKDSMDELVQVVWPTEAETRTYLKYTVITITTLAILLAVLGFLIRDGLAYVREQFPHENTTLEAPATQEDLDSLMKSLGTASGNAVPGSVTPAVNPVPGSVSPTPVATPVPAGPSNP